MIALVPHPLSRVSWSSARLRLRRAILPIRDRPRTVAKITNRFHRLYFDAHLRGGTWADTRWLGTPLAKCPLDLWIYQEIIIETRPDVLVETGTFEGGSAPRTPTSTAIQSRPSLGQDRSRQ
jgi:cephalosporin hydroxylase